jgi:hypothetical protein
MRNLPAIYQHVHTKQVRDCTMEQNIEASMALLGKLYTMTKRSGAEDGSSRQALEMAADAQLITEQLAKHVPAITWKAIVDACEERIYEDARPKISPVNIVRWCKSHYAIMPKPKQAAYGEVQAPVEASIEALKERYTACLRLWAHGKQVWDVGALALQYLVKSGKLPAEPTPTELSQMEPYVKAAIAREQSERKDRSLSGFDAFIVNKHNQQFGIKDSIIKHSRLINYIEKHENKQELSQKLPAPKSLLGH